MNTETAQTECRNVLKWLEAAAVGVVGNKGITNYNDETAENGKHEDEPMAKNKTDRITKQDQTKRTERTEKESDNGN